ncbi:ABC transporter permease [Nocardioides sp. BGMRC 2183]|nr:ABC transporter permease [Nocardioides sp. BGMRC 2183]
MSGLSGSLLLLRGHLRRDRWMILWWSLASAAVFWSQGGAMANLYATQAEFDKAAASLEGNAAFIAMLGPARALDTVGGQAFWQSSAFCAVLAGLMSMFVIGRHTRAEEESGRDELVRSGAIGRYAPLVAALLAAVVANVVLGLATAAGLLALRGDSPLRGMPLPVADSVASGVGLAACGIVFSATALVAAQLTQSTRTMYGIAGIVLGAAYLLRAVGDLGNGVASWLSPIGWYQAMHPYSGLRWWPLAVMLVGAAVGLGLAVLLFGRRDVGSGILAARPGPPTAGRSLHSSLGLAWRLQRGSVIGWTLGLAVSGLAYGSMGDSVEDLVGDSGFAVDAVAGGQADNLLDGFYGTALVMLALLAAGFAISSAGRPRAEEEATHLESVLVAGVPRQTWLAGHLLVTVAGTFAVLLAGGLGLGAGYAAMTGDLDAFRRYGVPVVAYLAPVLALSGLTRLLYGVAPRRLWLAWVALGFCVVVLMFGDVLELPDWMQSLSPFHQMPLVPAEEFDITPFLLVAAVAALLSGAGQMAFRRRDIG